MHELALAQSIVDIVEAQAKANAVTRVRKVHLVVGALAGVEPDALLFGFDSVTRGTIAEGATLELQRPPGKGACMKCGAEVVIEQRGDACPACGSYQVIVTGGDELRVAELEVD